MLFSITAEADSASNGTVRWTIRRRDCGRRWALKDEAWQATDRELRTLAVDAFRGHRRRRRQWQMATIALGLIVVVGFALLGSRPWPWPIAVSPSTAAQPQPPSPANLVRARYLSDDELLSQFPSGSCVLVEVDDRKQLVFLDREVERDYLAVLAVR